MAPPCLGAQSSVGGRHSDATNSYWRSILSLRSFLRQPGVVYMDPDNILDQSKVVCVCVQVPAYNMRNFRRV